MLLDLVVESFWSGEVVQSAMAVSVSSETSAVDSKVVGKGCMKSGGREQPSGIPPWMQEAQDIAFQTSRRRRGQDFQNNVQSIIRNQTPTTGSEIDKQKFYATRLKTPASPYVCDGEAIPPPPTNRRSRFRCLSDQQSGSPIKIKSRHWCIAYCVLCIALLIFHSGISLSFASLTAATYT